MMRKYPPLSILSINELSILKHTTTVLRAERKKKSMIIVLGINISDCLVQWSSSSNHSIDG